MPFSLHSGDSLINAGDPLFYAWNLTHNTESVFHGFKNLLDTNIFYPETNTLALSDTLFAQTIIAAPVIYLTHNPVFAENLYVFLTFPIAAISMFALSYYLTKHKIAATLAGLFFAFSYPRLAEISHISIISSQWLPVFVLYLIKFFDSGKYRHILLSFVFFFLSLTSTMYYGVFACIFGACISAAYFIRFIKRDRTMASDRLKKLAVISVPALCIVLIAVFPYIRLKAEHPEIHRSLDDATKRSLRLADYFTVLPTTVFNITGLPEKSSNTVAFPTYTVMLFAFISIITTYKRKKISALFLFLAVSSYFFSLGPTQQIVIGPYDFGHIKLPYYYAYKIFPLLQLVRAPERFSIFFMLSAAVLAAFGITSLKQKISNKYLTVIYIFIMLVFFAEIWQANLPFVKIPAPSQIPPVYQWLSMQESGTTIADLPLTPMHWGNSIGDQIVKQYSDISENDMLVSETYRVYFSAFHRKQMINGYSGFFPESYYDAAKRLASFPSDDSVHLLRAQNITYAIVHLWQYPDAKRKNIESALSANRYLKLTRTFENDSVYKIIQ